MAYLLDTNTCIFAMRGAAAVVAQIASHDPDDLFISSVTSYELYTGVEKCTDPDRERGKVERLFHTLRQVEFDLQATIEAAHIRADLELRGATI